MLLQLVSFSFSSVLTVRDSKRSSRVKRLTSLLSFVGP